MKRVSFLMLNLIAFTFSFSANSLTNGIDDKDEVYFNKEELKRILDEKRPTHFLLGQSRQNRNVEAWFFPGTSDRNALVIGGVHGSELSSVEVAKALINKMQTGSNSYYNVIIIPSLFPDNAMKAIANPMTIGTTSNIGRYTFPNAVDPNRQMPSPGKAYDEGTGLDHLGRKIEIENRLLLQLIQSFRPQRIINIHAIRNTDYGGVYADPRTDHHGIALGYDTDSGLAIEIAGYIYDRGGHVEGNNLDKEATALYYKDPAPAPAGFIQKRNMTGSVLNANRGSGISLGTWASTAVIDGSNPENNRDAIRIITMEYPGYKRPVDYGTKSEQQFQQKQIELFATAIRTIFLGNYFAEENINDFGNK